MTRMKMKVFWKYRLPQNFSATIAMLEQIQQALCDNNTNNKGISQSVLSDL